MVAFALPTNLVDSVRADRSPERDAWLAAVPGVVADFAGRWSLRLGRPYQPGGRSAWVASARDRTGRDLVLKVAWQHDEALHEADGLRAWAGNGAVLMHDSGVAEATMILLLERCRPGTTLGQALPEAEQDEIVASLLRRPLLRRAAAPAQLRPAHRRPDRTGLADGRPARRRPGEAGLLAVRPLRPGVTRPAAAARRRRPARALSRPASPARPGPPGAVAGE
jgi:hypothetical protein